MGDGREARKRGSEEARTGWPKDAPRLRQGGAAGREPETGENTRGSLGSPSNRSCFVLLVLTGLLFLLAARPHGDSHSPKRGLRNKRIVLDADIASPLRASTGTGAACWQFCCSLSGRGSPPVRQLLSKTIGLLRLHPVVLVVLESLRLVFIVLVQLCCFCCASTKAVAVPTFKNPFKSMTYEYKARDEPARSSTRRYRHPQIPLRPVAGVTPPAAPCAAAAGNARRLSGPSAGRGCPRPSRAGSPSKRACAPDPCSPPASASRRYARTRSRRPAPRPAPVRGAR